MATAQETSWRLDDSCDTVLRLIYAAAEKAPKSIALEVWGRRGDAPALISAVTYADLIARVTALSEVLQRTVGDPKVTTLSQLTADGADAATDLIVRPVVLVGLEGVDAVVAILAVWAWGGCWSAVDPDRPNHRAVLAADPPAFCAVLSTTSAIKNLNCDLAALLPTVRIDSIAAPPSAVNVDICCRPETWTQGSPNAPAYVLFTSGTTKKHGDFATAAVVGHRAVFARFKWMLEAFPFNHGERTCLTRPPTFVDAVWEALGPLCAGANVSVFSVTSRHDLTELANLLRATDVTRWLALPSVLSAISLHTVLPKLRLLFASGEALPVATAKRALAHLAPSARIINLYGSTEVAGDVTWAEATPDTPSQSTLQLVPIGRAIDGSSVRVDAKSNEIVVRGMSLPLGICRFPRAADHSGPGMIVETFCSGDEYWTGDRGFFLRNGELCFQGRLADPTNPMINRSGNRVSVLEIEQILQDLEVVRRCCVVVTPDNLRAIAFLELSCVATDAILNFGLNVPAALLPDRIEVVDALPLLSSGKIDVKLLQQQVEALPLPLLHTLPQCATQVGRIGRDILCEILGPKIGDGVCVNSQLPDRPLWHMGFDSLDTMVFKLRLMALLPGKRLPPGLTLDYAQISHLTPSKLLGLLEASSGKRHGAAADAVAVAVLERDRRLNPNTAQLRTGGITFCAAGDVSSVRKCIDDGWNGKDAVDRAGSNALHWAAGGGHTEVVSMLLAAFGSEPDFLDAKNKV